jgi:hypothetical protein
LQERLQQLADEQGEVFPPPTAQAQEAEPAKRAGKNRTKG